MKPTLIAGDKLVKLTKINAIRGSRTIWENNPISMGFG
jgi:hypothetical protein